MAIKGSSKGNDTTFMEEGAMNGSASRKEKILEAANQSCKMLGVDKVRPFDHFSLKSQLNDPFGEGLRLHVTFPRYDNSVRRADGGRAGAPLRRSFPESRSFASASWS